MGIQDEDVGQVQVGTGILDARECSSDTGRQVGKRVSKLYMNRAGNISTGLQLFNTVGTCTSIRGAACFMPFVWG